MVRPRRLAAMAWYFGTAVCAICVSGCGSQNPAAPPPVTAPPTTVGPATLADLSASVASREAGRLLNCREDVTAQVMLTNRAASAVAVTGVLGTSRTVSGGCEEIPEHTYAPSARLVGPGQTVVIMDRALYAGGSGCCAPGDACDGRYTCTVEERFTALTTPGPVPAGSFAYQVNFLNCTACSSVRASGRGAPAPPAR